MTVIISNGATTLNTASGFLRCEAYNLSPFSTTGLALSTTRYINATFANAGNCQGLLLHYYATGVMTNRAVDITLEQMLTVGSFNTSTERVNITGHGLADGTPVSFTSTGTLPTGITSGARYYVINSTLNDFQISTSLGGSVQGLSGTPSGTATCGAERANKVLSTTDIAGSVTTGTFAYRGEYLIPAIFDTPYAVDTTASKWRFRVAHGSGTGTWNIRTSDATNPFYVTWCDTAVTPSSGNDVLIVKDNVEVDCDFTTSAVRGTGDTANGIAMVICSNVANPSPDDVAYLNWENPPAAAYTLTVAGTILIAAFSGIRIGTSTNRIPVAQKATVTFIAPAAGTTTSRISWAATSGTYTYGGGSSLFAYGEIPAYAITHLSNDEAVGQTVLTCDDAVDWVNGDSVVIGKQNVKGQGVTTIHTVDSVSGNDITLTAALATNDRLDGATVIRLGGYGVRIQNTSTYCTHYISLPANFILSGVELYNQYFNIHTATSYYYYTAALPSAYKSQHLIQDCVAWTNSNSCAYLLSELVPQLGTLMQRVYCFRQNFNYYCYSYFANTFYSGSFTLKDSAALSIYTGTCCSVGTYNNRYHVDNVQWENARDSSAFLYLMGVNCSCKNSLFFGSAYSSAGALYVAQYMNPVEISGNTIQNNTVGMCFAGYPSVGCVDENATFSGNTTDIYHMASAFHDYVFQSPSGILVENEAYLPDTTVGHKVGYVDFDGTANDDRAAYTLGHTQRCGDSLTDTTVRTSGTGKFSLRMSPISETAFEWAQKVPTGNIKNKTMTVTVWVKLNAAAYYAGSHTNPTLSVNYDNGTILTDVAANSTDWQQLAVVFTPTTTYGQITVTISGGTDATGTDTYFYVDDMNIAYPAGYALDLGGLDIWASAMPVIPAIATVPSLGGVWDEAMTAHTVSGSFGKLLSDYVDAAVSTRLASSAYTSPPSAASIRSEIDANSTKLALIDAPVSSRLAGADYDAPISAEAIASEVLSSIVETEGSYTLAQVQSIVLAVLAGVTAGGGKTIKTPNGGSVRLVAVINDDNERTSMTLTP